MRTMVSLVLQSLSTTPLALLLHLFAQIFAAEGFETLPQDFCKDKPIFNAHEECEKYIVCNSFVGAVLQCPQPLAWDHERSICNWKRFSRCKTATTHAPTVTYKSHVDTRVLAKLKCDPIECKLPDCRCQSSSTPGEIPQSKIPQMILISFNGPVIESHHKLYSDFFDGRLNPNRCPAKASFFVRNDGNSGNDFRFAEQLYTKGHEIGISESSTTENKTSYIQRVQDIIGMKLKLTSSGVQHITGYRGPQSHTPVDTTIQVLKEYGFEYDSSIPLMFRYSQWWPFTMDYGLKKVDCLKPPCPQYSYKGFWEIPLTPSTDDTSKSCSTYQSCKGYVRTSDGFYDYLMKNFFRRYQGNRTPLTLSGNADWFLKRDEGSERRKGFIKFLNHIGSFNDAYIVSHCQALDWVRRPVPTNSTISNHLKSWSC